MPHLRPLRIVVASPGDVQAERDVLTNVVEELNHGFCQERDVRLDLVRWETDAYPGFHADGPQGLLDPVLRIADCDLLIGIFWKRFGTPTHTAQSGTEHEFLTAYQAWQERGRPQIMVYFNQRAATPRTVEEAEQWQQVLAFRARFPAEGLAWSYRGRADFERKVRQHLTRFIQHEVPREAATPQTGRAAPRQGRRTTARLTGTGALAQGRGAVAAGQGGVAAGGNIRCSLVVTGEQATVHVNTPVPDRAGHEARQRYLERLRRFCQALPLASLGADPSSEQDLTLDDVYIELHTTTEVPHTSGKRQGAGRLEEEERRPLTALEAFTQSSRLVLLGDPGSGKSTFVRKLLAWMAAAHLDKAPLPPDCAADLVPVLITLRDLAPALEPLPLDALSAERRRGLLVEAVRDHVLTELERYDASGFCDDLRAALSGGRCLLVLDGLDEVPPAVRQRVREAVQAVVRTYAPARLVVTCRVRSYVGEAVLAGFQAHTLAPFDREQIGTFAQAWYRAQHTLGYMDARQAEAKAADLAQAARAGELRELASNPMMLTTMAIIHQRDIGLPRERVRLYRLAVDVLLRRWQQGKTGQVATVLHPALAAVLGEERRVLPLLQALAYEAQRSRQDGQTVSDVPRPAALALLEQPEYLGDIGLASAFLEYVDHRAGLLMGRGGAPERPATYSFPHRVFQEYLAACHLLRQRSMVRTLLAHAREGEQWNLVVQLAAEELLYNVQRDNELLDLAYALCPVDEGTSAVDQRTGLWSGQMAALLGQEAIQRDTERRDGGTGYLTRLRTRLVRVLRGDLAAPERAEAGNALATLGDPRFRAEAWYLPVEDEPLLGFVEIPAGAFVMGEGRQEYEVALPTYYMARYPVTVAQFRAFVAAAPYDWKRNAAEQGAAHHPVVYVSWHDALAYCVWLTECLRTWPQTPEPLARLLRQEGWCVTLPSEAEWEKAARGHKKWRYPWGDKADPNRANYDETRLGGTNTVGCFPAGASPYQVEEMSGNVLEWTRSVYGDYPYPAEGPARAQRERVSAGEDTPRVLRGGAFWNDHQLVRCASRNRSGARDVFGNVGFRVVVRPCL
ncbi:MAG: SUMF1/EgtB/PvdO family nonheme iron enzyme [Candidatus Tectimicrobiota bacterium]